MVNPEYYTWSTNFNLGAMLCSTLAMRECKAFYGVEYQ